MVYQTGPSIFTKRTCLYIFGVRWVWLKPPKLNLLVNNHQDMLEYVSQIASRYCGWKISCTTLDDWNPAKIMGCLPSINWWFGFRWPIHRITEMIRLGSLHDLVGRHWLIPSRKHEAVPWPGCGDGGWIGSIKVGHPRYKLIENNAIIDVLWCIYMIYHKLS